MGINVGKPTQVAKQLFIYKIRRYEDWLRTPIKVTNGRMQTKNNNLRKISHLMHAADNKMPYAASNFYIFIILHIW